jgi:hypothetical protein
MIRAGTREDVPQIVDMGRVFWKETIYKEDFEPETVSELFNTCIDHGLMSVLEIDDKLEGFACGLKTPLIANSKVFLGTEVAWWVNPDHRQGKNGIGLLMALEKQAKEQGIKYWNMAYMQSSMPEKVEEIYKQFGYEKNEVIYSKVI